MGHLIIIKYTLVQTERGYKSSSLKPPISPLGLLAPLVFGIATSKREPGIMSTASNQLSSRAYRPNRPKAYDAQGLKAHERKMWPKTAISSP